MDSEVGPSGATSQGIENQLRELIRREGPWTGHNVELAPGVFTRGPSPSGDEGRFRFVKQLAADLARRPLDALRVLDLGAFEGQYGIEFALEGAEVLLIEGREASAQKTRFAVDALRLERASVQTEDVRNLSRSEHGEFDVVLCIGILYHLDQDGMFRLIQRMKDVCTDLLIVDTHVAREDFEIAKYGHDNFLVDPLTLSPIRDIAVDGMRYRGRDFVEHLPSSSSEERRDATWSSLDNVTSFWPTQPSLVNALAAAGFTTVFEPTSPWLDWWADRRVLVAKAGERVQLRSTSLTVGDYLPLPERQPIDARVGPKTSVDFPRLLKSAAQRSRSSARRLLK